MDQRLKSSPSTALPDSLPWSPSPRTRGLSQAPQQPCQTPSLGHLHHGPEASVKPPNSLARPPPLVTFTMDQRLQSSPPTALPDSLPWSPSPWTRGLSQAHEQPCQTPFLGHPHHGPEASVKPTNSLARPPSLGHPHHGP